MVEIRVAMCHSFDWRASARRKEPVEHFDLERTRRTLSDRPATSKRQANEMMQDTLRSVVGVVA
jgi:hypothetical protein